MIQKLYLKNGSSFLLKMIQFILVVLSTNAIFSVMKNVWTYKKIDLSVRGY